MKSANREAGVRIKVKRKESCRDLPLPRYATPGASGMDLYADVDADLLLDPQKITLVSTGLYLEIPRGYEAQIRPRSGLALKHGIALVNAPGTIDSDYRGLVSIIMINLGTAPFTIRRGDRIAQMIFQEVVRVDFEEVAVLETTSRAAGGFGHTGVR